MFEATTAVGAGVGVPIGEGAAVGPDCLTTRDGGRDGVFTFTVHGQACYALHEAHHHLLDAEGTLPGDRTPE